ncbi:MAG: hypothetical protein A2X86_10615 [Bdellovibrionales bacterium GWA2_49_15]|nr:MAG: hypothetical protein A2X86_10615 [Bdellovibrionales bacterium GWA2_49_15]HAZ11427.1 hypothetical protein [Bdellovibrionales bacterium]
MKNFSTSNLEPKWAHASVIFQERNDETNLACLDTILGFHRNYRWNFIVGTKGGLDVNPGEGYRANTLFQAPTSAADASHGFRLAGVTAGAVRA